MVADGAKYATGSEALPFPTIARKASSIPPSPATLRLSPPLPAIPAILMMTPSTHPFDEALVLHPAEAGGQWCGSTHPFYRNMVGPYGGVTAGQMLQAALRDPRRLGDPLSFTLHYAAPIEDGAFRIRTEVRRSNRSTQHWSIDMFQGDAEAPQTVMTGMLITAIRRPTWSFAERRMPDCPEPETLERFHRDQAPAWVNSFDLRYVKGPMRMRGHANDAASLEAALARLGDHAAQHSQSMLWMRDDPQRRLDFPGLASLCDIFFPRLFVRRPIWVPVGTISMSIHFHVSAQELAAIGADHVLGEAQANRFHGGFFDQHALIWSRSGVLLATTQQMVYFKL